MDSNRSQIKPKSLSPCHAPGSAGSCWGPTFASPWYQVSEANERPLKGKIMFEKSAEYGCQNPGWVVGPHGLSAAGELHSWIWVPPCELRSSPIGTPAVRLPPRESSASAVNQPVAETPAGVTGVTMEGAE